MPIPDAPTGRCAENDVVASGQPNARPLGLPTTALPLATAAGLSSRDFVKAVKDALSNYHSPDLLAQNPLLRAGISNLSGPKELRALLCETASLLFDNPRDEKLRRIIELTYFQPAPKQEAVAERLSLSFGTYRRHLATARDRLARWLWDNRQAASIQPVTAEAAVERKTPEGETTTPPETGARGAAALARDPALCQHLRQRAKRCLRRRHHRDADYRSLAQFRCLRDLSQHGLCLQGQADGHSSDRP
jgi:hypothetical protein